MSRAGCSQIYMNNLLRHTRGNNGLGLEQNADPLFRVHEQTSFSFFFRAVLTGRRRAWGGVGEPTGKSRRSHINIDYITCSTSNEAVSTNETMYGRAEQRCFSRQKSEKKSKVVSGDVYV